MSGRTKKPGATVVSGTEKREYDNTKRYWMKPSKRAGYYVADLKAGKIMGGKKAGQELSEYDKGRRHGYLQCQNDQTGMSKYRTMYEYSNNKEAAEEFSRSKEKVPGNTFMDRVANFFARFTRKRDGE